MNYYWFASAYDTGDIIFRPMTFVVPSDGQRLRQRPCARGQVLPLPMYGSALGETTMP